VLLLRTDGEARWRYEHGPRRDVIEDWDETERSWRTYEYESSEDWEGETVDTYRELS